VGLMCLDGQERHLDSGLGSDEEEPAGSRLFWSRPCPTRWTDMGVPELRTNITWGGGTCLACFAGEAPLSLTPGPDCAIALTLCDSEIFSAPRHGCPSASMAPRHRHCRVICGKRLAA
jgi:hypothetical protein